MCQCVIHDWEEADACGDQQRENLLRRFPRLANVTASKLKPSQGQCAPAVQRLKPDLVCVRRVTRQAIRGKKRQTSNTGTVSLDSLAEADREKTERHGDYDRQRRR